MIIPMYAEGRSGTSRMTRAEVDKLISLLPEQGLMLEVGSGEGVTASFIAEARSAARIVSVDSYPYELGHGDWPASPARLVNWRQNSRHNQTLWLGQLDTFHIIAKECKFDLILVDGNHTFTAVHTDLLIASTLLKTDGVLAAHDYNLSPAWPHVKYAVDRFLGNGYSIVDEVDTLVIIKKN